MLQHYLRSHYYYYYVKMHFKCVFIILFISSIQDIIGMRGLLALTCALATIPVFGLLAFTTVFPLVSTLWLGVTYSFAAVSIFFSDFI